jgi:uncharacterized protein YndB with AHSA1/START domain
LRFDDTLSCATMELPIEQDIVLPVSVDEAWDALTDAGAWLADDAVVDLREGGSGCFSMPDGGERRALIEEVVPSERLALWWWPVDADGVPDSPGSRVVFVLEPVVDGGGTRISVTDSPVGPLALAHA